MRFLLAILITILIHLFLFIQFETEKEKFKEPKRKVKKPTINLSNFKLKPEVLQKEVQKVIPQIKTPKPIKKEVTPEKEIVKKPTPKPKVEKRVVKKPIKEIKAKKVIKREVAKVEKKVKKEVKPESSEENLSMIVFKALQKRKIEELQKEVQPKKEQNLMGFLKTPTTSKSNAKLKQQPLKELYDDEYEYLSKEEKEFLEDNLAMIGYITQKHLEYPEIAGMTGQEGINVVEFYLFPNGDISPIKTIKSSNYNMLDKNTIKTIEYAYKEYPRPKQKTKIRIYTHYNIVGY